MQSKICSNVGNQLAIRAGMLLLKGHGFLKQVKISVTETCAFLLLSSQSGYLEYCLEKWKVQRDQMTMSNTHKTRIWG